jgi:hypothetical protein
MMNRRRLTLAIAGALLTLGAGAAAQHNQVPQKPPARQDGSEHHAGHHRVTNTARMTTANDPATGTLTVRIGPLDLPANTGHMAAAQAADQYLDIPFDGWITAYHPRLVDDTFNLLPGRLLHHVAFWNTSRSDFLCPNKEEHIFGAGGEMNDWPALPGFGYRVARGDRIRINTMFHNPTDTSYPRTYIEIRIEYKTTRAADGSPVQLKSVYPAWFDVQTCGHSGYDLAPGKNETRGEFALKYTGTLLGVGGHMHDYGVELALANATRGENVATLRAALDPQGRIQSMPIVTFLDRGGYRLQAGERISVVARYDSPTGKPLHDGAMGIVVGYFLPDNDAHMAALRRPANPRQASR